MNVRFFGGFVALALLFGHRIAFGADISGAPSTTAGLKPPERVAEPQLRPASDEPLKAMAKFRLPPNFTVSLWAAEPMLANPVAFSLDEKGNLFTAETYRYRTSALDIRHYMFMLEDDLASRNTNDRIAAIKKSFPNDWQKLGVETEVVRRLEDTNGDGKADTSTVFADGMNSLLDGINSGVLAHEGKVWCTNIPNLLLFSGLTANGRAEKREVLSSGYGVRFSFTGHDLHGLIFGPDGRLYFSCGDRGAHIVTQEGATLALPDEGAVFRCERDGSHLELVHRGLRNPQELAFDDHGNLFTGDNDSDQGDRERWVYLVEGGDSGWRVGYQHNPLGKENNPWLAEHIWEPRAPRLQQPASVLSPILNIPDGPSGIAYYPGTGLPAEFNGSFFVCGFKGTSARSAITSLKVREKGAGFVVDKAPSEFVGGVQATDVEFGPDSRIYFSEWGEGWEGTGRGRIFRLEHTVAQKAQSAEIAEVQRLIGEGFVERSNEELTRLLSHKDQRVRLRAQWALAEKTDGIAQLLEVAMRGSNTISRLHGIWGFTHAARLVAYKDAAAGAKQLEPLLALVNDNDAEVRAQVAASVRQVFPLAGNVSNQAEKSVSSWSAALAGLLHDTGARVRFQAALSMAKLSSPDAGPAIITMLRENADQDEYLRHAGVMALASCGSGVLASAAKESSASVRLAALLAMRRLEKAEVAQFLIDSNPVLVKEAARAINDAPIPAAFDALAKLIGKPGTDLQTALRTINANLRAGTAAHARALATFAANTASGDALRIEALKALGSWAKPFPRDRIVGIYRPLNDRDPAPAVAAINAVLPRLLAGPGKSAAKAIPKEPSGDASQTRSRERSVSVMLEAINTVARLGVKDGGPLLFALVTNKSVPGKERSRALETLGLLDDAKLKDAIALALTDADPGLRVTAGTMLGKFEPDRAARQLGAAFTDAQIAEKKAILNALGDLTSAAADAALAAFLRDFRAGNFTPEAQLELLEAAAKRAAPQVRTELARYESELPAGDALAKFGPALAGGDGEAGEKIFKEHAVAQCYRCHKIDGSGGEAGPDLTGIGSRKDRKYLLESIINPNAQIAEGFQSQLVTLKNGEMQLGIVKEENANELMLQTFVPGAPSLTVKKSEVQSREAAPSGMPAGMGDLLTRREIRDILEFLASLKESSTR